jgi:5-methylcytosine-specific restriction enzyme A
VCSAHTRRPRLGVAPQRVQTIPQKLTCVQAGSWRGDKTSSQRGYGYRWQKARQTYLDKHPWCVMCLRDLGLPHTLTGTQADTEIVCKRTTECGALLPTASRVDHKVPHQGDQRLFWDSMNWQSLCATHHDGEKAEQERAAGFR